MRTNYSDRVALGLVLIGGVFFTELVFSWGLFAYLLAAIYIFTTPGKFVHGLILGIVSSVFIVAGFFFADYPADQNSLQISVRFLLLFIIILCVISRKRNHPTESLAGQKSLLDSAIAERNEALFRLRQANKEAEGAREETKKSENEVVKGKRIHAAMAHHFPDGVICVLNREMRFVLADGRGLETLGLHKKDLRGEFASIGSGDELKRSFNGESVSFETLINHEAYTVNALPISDAKNEINEILIIIRNITDRKKLENNLFKALEKEK